MVQPLPKTAQAEPVEASRFPFQTTPNPPQAELVEAGPSPFQTTPKPPQAELVEAGPSPFQTTPKPAQPELVEAPSFFFWGHKEGRPFDKLREGGCGISMGDTPPGLACR